MYLRSITIGAIALACAALAGPSVVFAQTFTFTSSTQVTCWEDTEGFDANLQPIPVPSPPPMGVHFMRRSHGVVTGTTTFNLNGTVTQATQSSTTRAVTTGTFFAESQSACSGSWSFNGANQTLTTNTACNFQGTIPDSDTGSITGIQAVYQLTQGEQLVHSGPHPPTIETVNVTVSASGPFVYTRLCERAGTLFFLH
jgi:hypothetical protein